MLNSQPWSQSWGKETKDELARCGKIEVFVAVAGKGVGVGKWALWVLPITSLSGRVTVKPLSCFISFRILLSWTVKKCPVAALSPLAVTGWSKFLDETKEFFWCEIPMGLVHGTKWLIEFATW